MQARLFIVRMNFNNTYIVQRLVIKNRFTIHISLALLTSTKRWKKIFLLRRYWLLLLTFINIIYIYRLGLQEITLFGNSQILTKKHFSLTWRFLGFHLHFKRVYTLILINVAWQPAIITYYRGTMNANKQSYVGVYRAARAVGESSRRVHVCVR